MKLSRRPRAPVLAGPAFLSTFGCALAVSACGSPRGSGPSASSLPSGASAHQHASDRGHHHGHHHASGGPLVHRFENAEAWAREFDDPERDAWQRPGDVLGFMKIAPGMTVADIGAGTGYFEPWLSRAVGATGKVLALDVETDMVRYLGERIEREHLTNVRAEKVDLDDPKLVAGSVDRILIVDTWHHIDHRGDYAKKLRAALRPGGTLTIVDFKLDAKRGPPPAHRLAPESILAELSEAGFSARQAESQLPEQYVIVAEVR